MKKAQISKVKFGATVYSVEGTRLVEHKAIKKSGQSRDCLMVLRGSDSMVIHLHHNDIFLAKKEAAGQIVKKHKAMIKACAAKIAAENTQVKKLKEEIKKLQVG